MKIEISRQGTAVEVELEEDALQVGGGDSDGLCIEGLPPGLVTLHQDAGRLVMEARATLDINGVPCPPKVRRLLLADEYLALTEGILLRPGAAEPPSPPRLGGTIALLRGLLGGGTEPSPQCAATITCLTGLDLGRTYPLADGENELGRGEGVAIRVRDRAVSRRHARIVQGPGGCVLEDLGGPNGVFVNGQRLQGPRVLEGGEVLELGHSLLRFTAPPAPPKPTPSSASTFTASPADSGPESSGDPVPEPPPPPPPPPRRRPRPEWLLIGLGATLALIGALVSWELAR